MSNDTAESDSRKLTFQYWSDPMCIWAFVGQSKLDRILEEWGERVEVEYRIIPVFGSVPWRFREGGWSGGPEERRQKTCELARQHGIEDVEGEVWVDSEPHSSWACGAAAKAVFQMEEAGEADAGAGAQYMWEMREHFYRRDLNICHRDEQLVIADLLDIDTDALARRLDDGSALAGLWEDEHQREELGVRGSPSYVFEGGRAVLYGNFPFAVLHSVVEELVDGLELGGSNC